MHHDRRTSPPPVPSTASEPPVDATFVPHRYEPNYAYPLLVLLHGRGGDEQQLVRSMPTMSWRNYVGLGLRGPEPLRRDGEAVPGYDWGDAFRHPCRRPGPSWSEPDPSTVVAEVLRRGAVDAIDAIEDAAFDAVRRTRRALHIHSERIFLVGVGEGAAVAYRLGLTHPERFAGVVAINGWLPRGFRTLSRWRSARRLRVLALHGLWNARAPIDQARRDADLLWSAGLPVTLQTYPTAEKVIAPMLSAADSWLIEQCTAAIV